MGKRLAVLVGCNYPNTRFRLRGCINDVQEMGKLLKERFNFEQGNIKILIDESADSESILPTGKNIKDALKWMVDQAKVGDVLFFHFSGHGTLVTSLESGRYTEHEAIVPCDLNLVLDMDLRNFIRNLPSRSSFTVLSDSCHSGGLIEKDREQIGRDTDDNPNPPSDGLKTRGINFGTLLQGLPLVLQYAPAVIDAAQNVWHQIVGKESMSLKFKPDSSVPRSLSEDEGILLSGCEKDETSADFAEEGQAHGAFTNAVLQVLRENSNGISNKELVKKAREILKKHGFKQNACLYCSDANADAIFLSNCTPSQDPKDFLSDHLDDEYRRYIVNCGQRAAAIRDLFKNINGKSSGEIERLGLKENFFEVACLVKGNKFLEHKVTDFIYAGTNGVESAWFGYVAVTTHKRTATPGMRDILVCWRGTTTITEWINNAKIWQVPAFHLFGDEAKNMDVKVHSGFLNLYTGVRPNSDHNDSSSARIQVKNAVIKLVNEYQGKGEQIGITITGHSLGAALATLTALDIVANGYNKSSMVTALLFGGPRVGNAGLNKFYERLKSNNHLRIVRIENSIDIVPNLPPQCEGYEHLGETLKIDTTQSSYLKPQFLLFRGPPDESELSELLRDLPSGSISEEDFDTPRLNVRGLAFISAHYMEVYLHGVAIEGTVQEDRKNISHDIALVNKHLDLLKKYYRIPPKWWSGENRKKMYQNDDGRWEVRG